MCVRIRFTVRSGLPIYDSAAGLLTLPGNLNPAHRVTAVRAVLTELAVPQPELGAVCWCGEAIDLLPRVPDQQRRSEQVTHHGA